MRVADGLAAPVSLRGRGADAYAVRDVEDARLRLGDGTELAADIYRPAAPGTYPVLLMRQPYGRRIGSSVVLAHPAWYAARGYVVAIQDVRGMGDSTGAFRVLENEAADGAASLDWAAGLAGGNGQVATYGFSYHSATQFHALAGARRSGGKRPDAMMVAMGAWTVRDDWVYEGGAFRLAGQMMWACQIGAEQARRAGDREAYAALLACASGAPWAGERAAWPEALRRHAPPHYADWLADDPAFWARIAPAGLLADDPLDVPVLHVGGWLDNMLDGTLGSHAAFAARAAAEQRLMVGPWLHLPWGRRVGTLDLGPEAISTVDADTVAFFESALKGRAPASAPVRLFDVGASAWRSFDAWPDPTPTSLYLASSGRAATTTDDGTLAPEPAATGTDLLVHDPWRPAPSVGLHLGSPPGYQDRAAIDERTEVAVYTTAPLPRPTTIAGRVAAELEITCDRPSFDLHGTLSIVSPDGRAVGLTGGALRVSGDTPGPHRVAMRATCATVPAGHTIRLSVQAAAFPAFAVNPGTGARPEDTGRMDALVTTLAIASGGARPSRLLLPLLAADEVRP